MWTDLMDSVAAPAMSTGLSSGSDVTLTVVATLRVELAERTPANVTASGLHSERVSGNLRGNEGKRKRGKRRATFEEATAHLNPSALGPGTVQTFSETKRNGLHNPAANQCVGQAVSQ